MSESTAPARAEIVVDLAAVHDNVAALRAHVAPAAFMAVVKADGYGHGMVEVARAAREAGADWLGVATLDEARALRAAGDDGRVLCWLGVPGEVYDDLVVGDVDLSAYSVAQLDEIRAAASRVGRAARVQLKIDTGLARGGATPGEWPGLVAAARDAEEAGDLRVTGIWSHLVASDDPDHPANAAQEAVFAEALAVAETVGLQPEVRHLANSAAALLRPGARHDLVRCGLAIYGLDPAPGVTTELMSDLGLVPAMTVQGSLVRVKPVTAGSGVSYGHTWVAEHDTTLGLVPVGYADGVPRAASPGAEVWVAGRRRPLRGRVCMDQLLVDLGDDDEVAAGEPFVLLGPGTRGEPTAQDWAEAIGTISYEVVSGLGGRLTRRHVCRSGEPV
ncbi:alanine racemase [Nocardioides campestrisoli]|uniref:alanine racemase n=1 Tax=Nocardioides campestrisoli TaxID=2736757 RepID=UPI00163DCA69|nr:alanine racemase [Nocardioides campestrisoli]